MLAGEGDLTRSSWTGRESNMSASSIPKYIFEGKIPLEHDAYGEWIFNKEELKYQWLVTPDQGPLLANNPSVTTEAMAVTAPPGLGNSSSSQGAGTQAMPVAGLSPPPGLVTPPGLETLPPARGQEPTLCLWRAWRLGIHGCPLFPKTEVGAQWNLSLVILLALRRVVSLPRVWRPVKQMVLISALLGTGLLQRQVFQDQGPQGHLCQLHCP